MRYSDREEIIDNCVKETITSDGYGICSYI